jgi:hypothetical protein
MAAVLRTSAPLKWPSLFLHEFSSPQGYAPVFPADSVFEATYKLDELLRSVGGVLAKAVYTATQGEGVWRFHSEYQYENPVL